MILFSVIYGARSPPGSTRTTTRRRRPPEPGASSHATETDGARRAVDALATTPRGRGALRAKDEARSAGFPGFYDHAGRFVAFRVPVPLDLPRSASAASRSPSRT